MLDFEELAEHVSFETFLNCYLTECAPAKWHDTRQWLERCESSWPGRGPFVLELSLPTQELRLAFDVLYRSQVGTHRLGCVRMQRPARPWQAASKLDVVFALVRELYGSPSGAPRTARPEELELVARIIQSQQSIARYLRERAANPRPESDNFIESEQSILYGHWRHPTPKSRHGMSEWQHASFAPELGGRFQLHCFAAERELVCQRSALDRSAAELVFDALTIDAASTHVLDRVRRDGYVVVPVHPLQGEWLYHQSHVLRWLKQGCLRDLGRLGPWFTATSSVRTVYNADCPFMLKLSMPVKITNSLRFNRRHELLAGLAMVELTQKLGPSATNVRIISDPAFLTLKAEDGEESGFELLIRSNPFRRGRDRGVHCVAALVETSLPYRASRLQSIIEGLALTEGRSPRAVSLDWFELYMACAIEPLLRLYGEHGIALEAHQQNSLLDLTAGYPSAYYFRDNQGFYLSESHRPRLLALAPELAKHPELFFDDALIERHFAYYLIANQLLSVVHRLGSNGLLREDVALGVIRARLESLAKELVGPGQKLVRGLVNGKYLPHKANLLTRARDLDELCLEADQTPYVNVENPIPCSPERISRELEVA